MLISNLNAYTVNIDTSKIGTRLANAGTYAAHKTVGSLGTQVLPFYTRIGKFCMDKSNTHYKLNTPANIAGAATILCALGGIAYLTPKIRRKWNSLDENERCEIILTCFMGAATGLILTKKKQRPLNLI